MRILLILPVILCCSGPPAATLPLPVGTTTAAQLRFATTDTTGFTPMPDARAGDWLDRFKEQGLTFAAYVEIDPVRPDEDWKSLAFVQVGPFTEAEKANATAATEFAGIWFTLPIRTIDPADLPADGFQRERNFPWTEMAVTQYRTGWFLRELLPPLVPEDSVCILGMTMGDLYPDDSWNYVFGQSTFTRRVAVSSFTRYFAAFWGEDETDATRQRALRRSLKVTSHELGHAFGLPHCIEFECNMNGSNSLDESDRRPLVLCPPCLKKLQWNIGFDTLERCRRLLGFYREHGLGPEAEWAEARIRRIAQQ